MKNNIISAKKHKQKKIETIVNWVKTEYPKAIDRDYNSVIIKDFEIEFLENLVTITKDGKTRTHGINTEGVYLNIINMFPELDMVLQAKYEQLDRLIDRYADDVLNSHMIEAIADNDDANWYLYTIRRREDDVMIYPGITQNPFARWKDHFGRTKSEDGSHGCGYFHGLQEELYLRVEENLGKITKKEAQEFEAHYKQLHEAFQGELANRKLSREMAQEIRDRYKEGSPVIELATDYEISQRTVRKILAGDTYRY